MDQLDSGYSGGMSEKGRIALIFGAVAAVAGGGLFYFFKIHQPKQQRAAAQAEVLDWGKRLDAARACLLGPAPASGNSAEALAVREMTPDPWDRATCTKLIGKLSRGVADDTGMMPVEHAWMSIDRAAAKVATAFLDHVDPSGVPFEKRTKESPLPAALEELDTAHADLRKAASMDPPATATQATLPEASIVLVTAESARVRSLDSWSLPSAGGVVAFGSTDKGQVQLQLAPGATPRVLPVPNDAVRAVPDATWGAAGLFDKLTLAPIDAQGAFGAMTELSLTGAPPGIGTPIDGLADDSHHRGSVLGAAGTFTRGVVAGSYGGGLVLARADGGAFTADPPRRASSATAAMDLDGRLLVAWTGSPTPDDPKAKRPAAEPLATDAIDGRLHAFLSKGDTAPAIVEIGAGHTYQACLSATAGWIMGDVQVTSFDGTAARPHVLQNHVLVGCSREGALLRSDEKDTYTVCTDDCRVVDIPGFATAAATTLVDGKAHAVQARARVLGVWRENAPPRFFALPHAITPILATSDGKVLDVLATADDGVVVVRVPVR
jgi:hypothetical protein